jgi:hypothetical protein
MTTITEQRVATQAYVLSDLKTLLETGKPLSG